MADFEIKIDKGIPLPEDTRSRSNYPFADMEVGDSIFIPLEEGDNAQREKPLSQATPDVLVKNKTMSSIL